MELKRKIYDRMLEWKAQNGRTAMFIDGARRVGKSHIAELFAQQEYKSYILIDFANVANDITDLIENESYDLDLFFVKLSAFYNKSLYHRESLIIFDEVQQFPRARQLIKYLVADGRYDYLETGSLIRIKKNAKDIVIPSEEEHIEMFPLDFEEFLWAMDDTVTVPFIHTCFEKLKPLGQALHRKVMNEFRQYILVGGMPQAVVRYVETKQFEEVDSVKRQILQLYRNDITKFAPDDEDKIFTIFDGIPAQLSRKEKKYRISSVSKTKRFKNFKEAFAWLNEAMITNYCLNCTDPNIGLSFSTDYSTQKTYMGDTGLLITQAFANKPYTENDIYKAVLFDKLEINEGMVMENIVSQMLRFTGHKLFFYSRSDNKNRANHMEIDFVITQGKKICPIEVKSGNYRSHSFLDKFRKKFSSKIGTSYILYSKDVMIKDDIVHLPLYMTMFL